MMTTIVASLFDPPVFFYCQDACPKNASYYGNRAATLMMLCRFREALEDSQQAVRLDECFMKVRIKYWTACIQTMAAAIRQSNRSHQHGKFVVVFY